jgi:uncharacterized protein (DUF2147 family)
MKNIITTIVFCLLAFGSGYAQVGTWKTIDDATSKAKSYIEIYEENGKLYGKITKLLLVPQDKKCFTCSGKNINKPLLGMVIIENMMLKDGFYQGGTIMDPDKGKVYDCKIWLKQGDPNVLVVRGYNGPFYRTQYWYRVQ